jgi:hypothetical protein
MNDEAFGRDVFVQIPQEEMAQADQGFPAPEGQEDGLGKPGPEEGI